MKTYVLYHAHCADGFCSAWIAHHTIPDAVFLPVQYGEAPPTMEPGSQVLILDFSYPRDVLLRMKEGMGEFRVLDHHKTAEAALQGLAFCRFDMEKSGARLTWEHFYGSVAPPGIVEYVEDRDLWRWALVDSREVNACVRSYPQDFEVWNQWRSYSGVGMAAECRAAGAAILRREQQIVSEKVAQAWEISMDGHLVLVVNATCLISETAGALAVGRPFGASFFVSPKGRHWSLRSRDGGVDVSEVAARRGGGGHRNAAGFLEAV